MKSKSLLSQGLVTIVIIMVAGLIGTVVLPRVLPSIGPVTLKAQTSVERTEFDGAVTFQFASQHYSSWGGDSYPTSITTTTTLSGYYELVVRECGFADNDTGCPDLLLDKKWSLKSGQSASNFPFRHISGGNADHWRIELRRNNTTVTNDFYLPH